MSAMTNGERVGEALRILRAAADGRLRVNEHGRYVIAGEKRPDRKAREYLQRSAAIVYRTHRITASGLRRLRESA